MNIIGDHYLVALTMKRDASNRISSYGLMKRSSRFVVLWLRKMLPEMYVFNMGSIRKNEIYRKSAHVSDLSSRHRIDIPESLFSFTGE